MTNTVKVKTESLNGPALDWAVAKCKDIKVIRCGAGKYQYLAYIPKRSAYKKYSPSTNWVQGGPIIEREHMAISWVPSSYVNTEGCWSATIPQKYNKLFYANTPLISAMRCYVVSRLGDEIEIPKELA